MSLPVCVEGRHTKEHVPVTSDVYNISERIKAVDERFFVMLNRQTQRFEVHVKGQPATTFGCELPFDTLDARALEYVRKYSAARTQNLARDIAAHNDRLAEARSGKHIENAGYKMREAIMWAENHPSNQMPPEELIAE